MALEKKIDEIKLLRAMKIYEHNGYCTKHDQTSKAIEVGRTNDGFYIIYQCCAKAGDPLRLRTNYRIR